MLKGLAVTLFARNVEHRTHPCCLVRTVESKSSPLKTPESALSGNGGDGRDRTAVRYVGSNTSLLSKLYERVRPASPAPDRGDYAGNLLSNSWVDARYNQGSVSAASTSGQVRPQTQYRGKSLIARTPVTLGPREAVLLTTSGKTFWVLQERPSSLESFRGCPTHGGPDPLNNGSSRKTFVRETYGRP